MTAEEANLLEEQLMSYYASQKEKWDLYAMKKGALEEGREEGILQVARAMKAKGITVDMIIDTTGLSAEVIADLF